MIINDIKNMKNGWFVGNFRPAAFSTEVCEVAHHSYKKGNIAKKHYHKISTEINYLLAGTMKVNGKTIEQGSIFILEPWETSDTEFLSDVELIIVKVPSSVDDKYVVA